MANSFEKDFAPAGFFAFRTPLLPYEELEAFSAGLAAPPAGDDPEQVAQAVTADRALLRERLAALIARPEVLEAVFIASPSLYDGLAHWRREPDGKKGLRAERALVRYLYRMAARATPFGLFSGCSLGTAGTAEATRLVVAPRAAYERHTRLDMDYLFALCEDLVKDPAVRDSLLYRPNSSLYRAAGRLRYAEARLDGKIRSHHLVAVDATDYLDETLRRAASGAAVPDLAQALVEADPDGEITLDEATEFVHELIASQLLVSELSPPVTGPEAIHDLIDRLESLSAGQPARQTLIAVRDALASLDAQGPGQPPERYLAIAESLKALPTEVEMSRLFQLDMVKAADGAALGPAVMAELARATEVVARLGQEKREDALDRFRKAFTERYEDRQVPLLEALDEEVGIGFDRSADHGAEASPLLHGMALGGPPAPEPQVTWGRKQAVLLTKLHEAIAAGADAIELTDADLDRMAPPPDPDRPVDRQPLPDGLHVMVTLAAPSAEAADKGEFLLLFDGAGGPSGARLLGRFCHADTALTQRVEAHLRAEEAARPDAVFAEVVHLPQGRIGNILARPVLRDYEIPFLGRSGAPAERQIPVTDLLVAVQGQRIVLRSARLGKEVLPRLTSAHNFWTGSLGVYRFLCMLQGQQALGGFSFGWGALDGSPFLPRVTSGRTVLSRALWWITEAEIKELVKATGTARWSAVQAWRAKRSLPRLVALMDADNELLVDFDNVLSIDTFLDVIEGRDRARLTELFPGPGELLATGPEGRFVHEILVPWNRRPPEAKPEAARPARTAAAARRVPRSFPPGSEWLYAKLYTGTSTADRVLTEAVGPVVREALAQGLADGWFFIRYADPDWHLRLRMHGAPEALDSEVLPRLHAAVGPMLADGRIHRMQLDTYGREIERYGGAEGIELCERIFEIDSDAVLAVVEMLEGDEGADVRWRLALRGTEDLLSLLCPDPAVKQRALVRMRQSFAAEFGGGKGLRVQLDRKYRQENRALAPLLTPERDAESALEPGLAVLRRRNERLAPLIAELFAAEHDGRLLGEVADLAGSVVHMHVNRMIRSAARAHELVLYDLLGQLLESRAARERKKAAAVGPQVSPSAPP